MNNSTPWKKLWFFDFDGTLSPIVSERSKAMIHRDCKKLLEELVAKPFECVAVISSRLLDDLIPRVGVSGVFLGGGSGVEWYVEGKDRWTFSKKMEKRLQWVRAKAIPRIMEISKIPGIEIEDKKWSVAVHTRKGNTGAKRKVVLFVEDICTALKLKTFKGPEVIELQLLPEIDKAFGVRALCEYLRFRPVEGSLFYAGDDENDATAMRWVLQRGGIALTVGHVPVAAGTGIVRDSEALVREIRNLEGKNERLKHVPV